MSPEDDMIAELERVDEEERFYIFETVAETQAVRGNTMNLQESTILRMPVAGAEDLVASFRSMERGANADEVFGTGSGGRGGGRGRGGRGRAGRGGGPRLVRESGSGLQLGQQPAIQETDMQSLLSEDRTVASSVSWTPELQASVNQLIVALSNMTAGSGGTTSGAGP